MSSVEKLQEYVKKCGLESVTVDEKSLFLYGVTHEVGKIDTDDYVILRYEIGYDYYLKPRKEIFYFQDFSIYRSSRVCFFVRNNRLEMLAPVFRLSGSCLRGNILSLIGEQEAAVILFTNLPESFSHFNR